MSRVKSALIGSVSAQVFLLVTILISIVTTPVFLNHLSPEEYGASIILFQIISYLWIFDFGLGIAITRQLAQYREPTESNKFEVNRIVSTSFFIFVALGLLIVILGFWLAPNIYLFFEVDDKLKDQLVYIVLTLAAFLGIQFPLRVFSSIFYAHQKQLVSNLMGFYISIINTGVTLVLILLKFGLWSFVYANLVTILFNAIVAFYYVNKHYPYIRLSLDYFDKSLLKELFHYGFFIFLSSVAVQIIFYTDRIIIGSLISLASVTVFSLTARVPELSMQLIFKVTQSSFPALIEINKQEPLDKSSLFYTRLMTLTISLVMVAFWMIFCFNRTFIELWVGEKFYAGTPIVLLCLLIMLLHSIVNVHTTCLNSAGKVKSLSIVSLIEALINIGLSLWLCKRIGMYGVLLGTIIASLVSSSWYSPYCNRKHLGLSLNDFFIKPILRPLIVVSVIGFGLYCILSYAQKYYAFNWLTLIGTVAVACVIMAVFVWNVLLKPMFKDYVPTKYRKLLLLK